jgi:hypothetical protein
VSKTPAASKEAPPTRRASGGTATAKFTAVIGRYPSPA